MAASIKCVSSKRKKIRTKFAEIKSLIRELYEQMYTNKLDNSDKMDKFIKKHKLPKLTRKEIESLNRPMTNKEIGLLVLKLLTKKSPDSHEFYQTFRLISIFHKFFQKIE